MLTQERVPEILEWLAGLDLGKWIFILALAVSWLAPLIRKLWKKERERREKSMPGMSGPIEPR